MDSQQAAFEKFKAAGAGRKFTRESRNAEGTSSNIEGPVPDLYSIHHGKVVRVEGRCNYGAFVQIPGFKRHGLVFKNQASKHFTQNISDVVAMGDHVKVTSTQDGKIALSMKHVSQGDGTDLDPNLVQFTEEQDKKRVHSGFIDKKPIAIEDGGVLLKTVCKKCGAAGHLAAECFSGGEKFDLLEDDDEDQETFHTGRHEHHRRANDDSSEESAGEKRERKRSDRRRRSRSRSPRRSDDRHDRGNHRR
ncbi:Nucleolar protein of 40 kDa [Mortierella sp. AM989]|nr:Nucleolar protein of 40 kDa [Mortierella sp. AM989]